MNENLKDLVDLGKIYVTGTSKEIKKYDQNGVYSLGDMYQIACVAEVVAAIGSFAVSKTLGLALCTDVAVRAVNALSKGNLTPTGLIGKFRETYQSKKNQTKNK